MAFTLIWSPDAIRDLESISEYISRDSFEFASVQIQKIIAVCESICIFPFSGRKTPEIGQENIRERLCGNYRIIYRVRNEAIEILAIHHGARLLDPKDGKLS